MILARARLRTGALWFSIGLHAGWIAAFKGFNMLHRAVPVHELRPWGVGDSLRSGLLPMLALGVTAVVCHFVLQAISKQRGLDQPRITVTTRTLLKSGAAEGFRAFIDGRAGGQHVIHEDRARRGLLDLAAPGAAEDEGSAQVFQAAGRG